MLFDTNKLFSQRHSCGAISAHTHHEPLILNLVAVHCLSITNGVRNHCQRNLSTVTTRFLFSVVRCIVNG